MNIRFFISLLLSTPLFSQSADTSLILSEIMFTPQSGNNEFIEIYNRSETEAVDLNNYKIQYHTSNNDIIISAGSGSILPPKSYAIILEGDYDFASGIYNNIIPQNALILKISDNAFGSSGMANASDRIMRLVNPVNDTLDVYTYSANNAAGISDERIILNKDSSASNWSNSLQANGTPGFRNSVTPLNFDLQTSFVFISPAQPFDGDDVAIFASIKNSGSHASDNYIITIFNDINFDSVGASSEIIYSQVFTNLQPDDSNNVNVIIPSVQTGNYNIIVKIDYDNDEDTLNNISIFSFVVMQPGNNFNDIVINEIMYAPSSGQPEWVELLNRTSSSINLKGWKFSDNSSSITITNSDIFIQHGSFIILGKDSSIINYYSIPVEIIVFNLPSLNNTGDAALIKDSLNILIDSINYFSAWGGNNGKSLERINPDLPSVDSSNWNTSISKYKATPGYINSVTQKDFDLEAVDIIFSPPNPFFGDNISIAANVKNNGNNFALFSLKLYEDTGLDSTADILLETLPALAIQQNDSAVYPFTFTINNITDIRSFYALVEFQFDQDTSNNGFIKSIIPGYPSSTIIINEIMYTPAGGEPEWIEIYNTSEDTIDIKDWKVSDVITTPAPTSISSNIYIEPKAYLVLTKDSSIINYHRFIPSKILKINLPVLNNDSEGVILKDNRGVTIDSIYFNNSWGGTGGYSLERLSFTASSNLQGNWASSFDVEMSTPGRINSVTPKTFDLSISEISFDPRFPIEGDNVFINAKIKNNGSSSAINFIVEFYISVDSTNTSFNILNSISGLSIEAGDSLTIRSGSTIINLNKKILTAAKIIFNNDEDTLNNYAERFVEPGIAPNVLLINEVMYDPPAGEPEWFELINVSKGKINLRDWSISDILSTPTKNFITNIDLFIEPGEFLIIARDTSFYNYHSNITSKIKIVNFGTLGNTEDGIIIYDFRNGIIDSLSYRSSWGGKNGYSLERISLTALSNDSSSWATSLSETRSTPGLSNSILNIPSYDRNSLIINEIMFDPDIDNNEFIELINLSNENINIGGWKIEDEAGNFYKLSETSMLIPANSYFLFSADSLMIEKYSLQNLSSKSIFGAGSFGFTNSGELILLKDVKGNIIDSVWYSDKWHNKNITITKNRSLERINPQISGNEQLNWNSSADFLGATPGRQNSIYTDNSNKSSQISISPNPFSPDEDGFEDFSILNYSLSQPTSQIRVKVYDSKGRLVRTLINNQASGSQGAIIFDGLDDESNRLRIGIYIILLEAVNENSGVVENLKTIVVVARKL